MSEPPSYREICSPEVMAIQPLVSVQMLAYRHERFLAEAIQGVIAQVCNFPIELIIAEDCSPDGTLDIALHYQRHYPQLIRVVTGNTNVGLRTNSYRSISIARGKYIAICEGDDFWTESTKLAKQVHFMESATDAILVCHPVNRLDVKTGQITCIHRPARRSRYLSTHEIISGDGDFIPTCSIMVRKSVYADRPGWWEDAPIGDYPLVLRATQLGRIAYFDNVMATYRVNVPESWTHTQGKVKHINGRYAHATAIKRLLLGYDASTNHKYTKSTRQIIRKYLFNAIVRGSGGIDLKRAILRAETSFLTRSDRALARIALASGRKLTTVRIFPSSAYRWLCSTARDITGIDSII